MRSILLLVMLATHAITICSDHLRITDRELKSITGKYAAEIVDMIENDGDPNPVHMRYLSAPTHLPDVHADIESRFAQQRPPYRWLCNNDVLTPDEAREKAYELRFARDFRLYHAQPIINELERRLSRIAIPEMSTGFPRHQSSACTIPTMLTALCGCSPQLIQHLLNRGFSANPEVPSQQSLTDIACCLLMDRIPKADSDEFAIRHDVVSTLLTYGGKLQLVTPQLIYAHQQQQTTVDAVQRYNSLYTLVSRNITR